MLQDGGLDGSDVQLKSKVPTDLVQQAQYLPLQLASDKEQTKQLVSDIREALENPTFDEAIQEALAKAGVPERLQQQEGNNLAGSHHSQAGWGPGSPRSTITFAKTSKDAAADKPLVASAAGDSTVKSSGNSGEGANEIRHQVESLLQRTDSILSRSSGRSSLRRSVSNILLHSLNATSANPSPHAPTPLRPAGAFDFDAALPALETPTMKSTTGSGPRDAAGTTVSGGLSLTGNRRRTAAIPFTASRRPGAQNEYNNSGPIAVGLGLPEVDALPNGNANGTFDGLLPLSGDGDFTDARRLSEQALSEIGDRFDSHANLDRQNRGFESGSSADRTTVVLDRSASYKINAAQAGAGPYTNFAPLGQLADAVTESVAAAMQGALATAAASAAAAAAGIGARARSSSSDNANGRASGGGMQLPKQQVSNRIALANMLLPEYVESAALAKLKAELTSLSNPGPRSHVEGSQFDAVLMTLIARLSLWPQVERKSEEMFRKMLNAILDKIFSRLLPSKGGLTQLPAAAADYSGNGDQSNDSSLSGAVGGVGAGLMGGAAGASSSGVSGGGSTAAGAAAAAAGNGPDLLRRSYSRGKATAAAGPAADSSGGRASDQSRPSTVPPDGAADADEEAPQPKPSDSMLKAAFAKLAFGQAMLRGGGPMMSVKPALAATSATATKGAPAAADGTDADTVAGTPDVGMSPALSRTSSIATSVSTAAAQLAVASKPAAGTGPKSQQRVQWSSAVATVPSSAAPVVEANFSLAPGGARGTQVLQLQQQAQPMPAADAKNGAPNILRRQPSSGTYGSPGAPQGHAAATSPRQDVQHPKISTPEKQQRPRPAGSPVESAWLINLPPPWRQPPQQQRVEVTPVSTPPPPPAPELQPRQKSPGWLDGLNSRYSSSSALQSAPGVVSPTLARLQTVQQQQQQQYYGAPLQSPRQQQRQQLPQRMETYGLSVATPFGVSQEQMQGSGPPQTYWGSPGRERCIGRSMAGCDAVSSLGVANLSGTASSPTCSWVEPSPAILPQPLAQPWPVHMHQQPAMQTLLPAPQQQQKLSALQQQQLARVLTVDSASNSSGSRAASTTPPLLHAQQGFAGNVSAVEANGPTYHGRASRSPVATVSKTLAAMQHRYEQQDGVRASLFQQQPQQQLEQEQVQPQQQESLLQSWLAPDGSLSREASPIRAYQHHTSCSTPASSCNGLDYSCPTMSQAMRQLQFQQNSPIQQHSNPLNVGTATVRVSSPGAKPGSPLKQRVAMPGGCINVYSDAVEVHSSSPLEIRVSPGPAVLSGVAGAGMM